MIRELLNLRVTILEKHLNCFWRVWYVLQKYLKIVPILIFSVLPLVACSDLSKMGEDGSEGGNLSKAGSEDLTLSPENLRLKAFKEATKFIADINALAGFSIFNDLKDGSIKDLGGGASYDNGVYFASNGDRYEVLFNDDFATLGRLLTENS